MGITDEPVEVASAWLQYRVARQVWSLVDEGRLTVEALATELGQSPEAQRKKLSGAQAASLRDLVAWIMAAGQPAYDAVAREDSDFFPTKAWGMLSHFQSGGGTLPRFKTPREPAWPQVVAGLASDLASMGNRGRAHLLTSDWVRQVVISRLDEGGVAPQNLRLTKLNSADALQVGALDPTMVLCDLVHPAEAVDPSRASATAVRLRNQIANLSEVAGQGIAVLAALDGLGQALLDEALAIRAEGNHIVLGPYEAVNPDPGSSWWSHHQVELIRLASEDSDRAGIAIALRVMKAIRV